MNESSPEILSSQDIGALVGLVNRQRLSEAEHRARALLRRCPNAEILWKILGVALLRQGKDALPALRRSSELLPNDAEAHGNLDAANAMKALGRALDAVALYQRALQLDPRLLEAQNNLGNAFLELRRHDEAARCYRLALALQPDNAQVHCNLSNALRQLGQLDEAMISSRRAIALDPGLSVAHNSLGLILAALGQCEQAAASYRRCLALNPDDVEAIGNLAAALRGP